MEQQRTAMEQRSMERAGPLLTAGEASQGTRLTAADSNEQSRPDASRKRRADHEIIEVD